MLHYEAVDIPTLELLKQLQSIDLFQQLRLVGGTALALQKGHRKSIDLDLFGSIDVDVLEINNALSQLGNITQIRNSKNIHIYIINGIKVDIVNYTYPWLNEVLEIDGIRLAGYEDIAAMKLAAISGRGTKKDFVDIYYLLNLMSLSEMVKLYQKKFADGSIFMVLKSFIYFEDAEKDVMPDMIKELSWLEVKEEIIEAHTNYIQGLK